MLFHDEIEEKGAKTAFKDLPLEAQKSLIFYMAVDGDAWADTIGDNPVETDADWEKAITDATKAYGDKIYTLYEMPVETFKDLIMQTPSDFAGWFDTFDDYHAWYIDGEKIPNHSEENRWPALAWDDREGIVDGWHRTHGYVRSGHKTLPFIL